MVSPVRLPAARPAGFAHTGPAPCRSEHHRPGPERLVEVVGAQFDSGQIHTEVLESLRRRHGLKDNPQSLMRGSTAGSQWHREVEAVDHVAGGLRTPSCTGVIVDPGVLSKIRRSAMSDHTYRVTEIVGSSPESLQQAIRNGVARAGKTLRNLEWFEVTEIRGQMADGAVAQFQVGLKVGFRLDDAG